MDSVRELRNIGHADVDGGLDDFFRKAFRDSMDVGKNDVAGHPHVVLRQLFDNCAEHTTIFIQASSKSTPVLVSRVVVLPA